MTLQRTVCLVPDETFPEIPANSLRLLPSTGDFCICADEVLLSPLPYHPQIVLIGIVAPICLSPFCGRFPFPSSFAAFCLHSDRSVRQTSSENLCLPRLFAWQYQLTIHYSSLFVITYYLVRGSLSMKLASPLRLLYKDCDSRNR